MDGHVEPTDRAEPTGDPSSDPSAPSDPSGLRDPSHPSGLRDPSGVPDLHDSSDPLAPSGAQDLPDASGLPDLTQLSLAELGTVENPLLQEVLADLRERARRPSEMLWGWNSSF